MKAGKAVGIAKTWVEREALPLPGFHAAHLSGSLGGLSGGEDLPDYTDIDIYCVMDEEHRFPQKKFRYRGAFLETVSQPLSDYRSPEAVLSHPYLAHNFLGDGILADPEGLLEPIHRRVMNEFAQPRWLRARYRRAKSTALGVIEEAGPAENLNAGFGHLFRAIRLMNNLILIAHLRAPTVRTSICRAREVLAETGQASLTGDFLRLLGSASFSREQVRTRLAECARAFDRAAKVYRTPIPPGFNLDPSVRPYLIEGSEEMISAGDHREAMLWIAAIHWIANLALQNDCPEEEKPRWQDSLDRLYAELGLNDLADYSHRMGEANEVALKVINLTDGIANPQNS
jgi:hypothetical protein